MPASVFERSAGSLTTRRMDCQTRLSTRNQQQERKTHTTNKKTQQTTIENPRNNIKENKQTTNKQTQQTAKHKHKQVGVSSTNKKQQQSQKYNRKKQQKTSSNNAKLTANTQFTMPSKPHVNHAIKILEYAKVQMKVTEKQQSKTIRANNTNKKQ